jgi:hypothetical protein
MIYDLDTHEGWEALTDRLAAALSENMELRKDAERYRWFRTRTLWDADAFPFPKDFVFDEAIVFNEGLMLDAAIDAAKENE